MSIPTAALCSLATVATCSLDHNSTTSPTPDSIHQSTSSPVEDVAAVPAEIPPSNSVSAIAPPEVAMDSLFQSDQRSYEPKEVTLPSNSSVSVEENQGNEHLSQDSGLTKAVPEAQTLQTATTTTENVVVPVVEVQELPHTDNVSPPENLPAQASELLNANSSPAEDIPVLDDSTPNLKIDAETRGRGDAETETFSSYSCGERCANVVNASSWESSLNNSDEQFSVTQISSLPHQQLAIASPEIIRDAPFQTHQSNHERGKVIFPSNSSASVKSDERPENFNQELQQGSAISESQMVASKPTSSSSALASSSDQLGEIRIIPPPPKLQLQLRSSASTSADVNTLFLSNSNGVFVTGATLLATPRLGSRTHLLASLGGDLVRIANGGGYDSLNLSLGVQQRLARNTSLQVAFAQGQIYQGGNRELLDNSVLLRVIRQDKFDDDDKLRLASFYELRTSFADPEDQSRIANTLGARLGYNFTDQLEGALDYRIVVDTLTGSNKRTDVRQQVSAVTTYRPSRNSYVSGSISYLFGSASTFQGTGSLNNLLLEAKVGVNLSIF